MNFISNNHCCRMIPLGSPILKSVWKIREKGNRFALDWILKLTAIFMIECLLTISDQWMSTVNFILSGVVIAFPDWVPYKNSKKPSRFPKPWRFRYVIYSIGKCYISFSFVWSDKAKALYSSISSWQSSRVTVIKFKLRNFFQIIFITLRK